MQEDLVLFPWNVLLKLYPHLLLLTLVFRKILPFPSLQHLNIGPVKNTLSFLLAHFLFFSTFVIGHSQWPFQIPAFTFVFCFVWLSLSRSTKEEPHFRFLCHKRRKTNERTEGDLLNGLKVYKFKLKKKTSRPRKWPTKLTHKYPVMTTCPGQSKRSAIVVFIFHSSS